MQLILLEKVRNLGDVGDKVKVKEGYGRNFLVPQGKAVYATKDNIARFEQQRAALEKAEKEKLNQAKKRAEALENMGTLTMHARASAEGKLYGSIGPAHISEAITQAGVEVERREVDLPGGAIRFIGEYEIKVILHSDIEVTMHLNIQSEA